MFPFPMFSTNPDGILTVAPDYYSNLRPMIPFSNGDFSFSLLPQFQPSFHMPSDQNFSQHLNQSNSDRSNLAQTVTIRIIMSGKEVGSIIGKKGDNVKKFREQSGARINISDGSCPERIVSVSGTVEKVSAAFLLICQKFEDDYIGADKDKSDQSICPPVTLRLLVPATQCGSIIGKGGCKIKEIRDMCGASIQVASDLLPSSSERSVTVSGTATSLAKCIKQISLILLETPIKFGTLQYKPKPAFISSPPIMNAFNTCPRELLKPPNNLSSANIQPPIALFPLPPSMAGQLMSASVLPSFLGDSMPYGNFHGSIPPMWMKPSPPLSYPSTPDLQTPPMVFPPSASTQQIREMAIANDLIGCVIGRSGNTINEIRSMSGAQIKISDIDDTSQERHIIISGSVESVNTAQLLINSNIQSYRNSLTPQSAPNSTKSCPSTDCTSGQPPTHGFVQRMKPKMNSHTFNLDGSRRMDHVHYNPY